MEQPTEQPTVKKTADKNAYMREYMRTYRLANLEKCREQDRAKYHRRKPVDEEEKMKRAERMVLNALAKYPDIINTIWIMLNIKLKSIFLYLGILKEKPLKHKIIIFV